MNGGKLKEGKGSTEGRDNSRRGEKWEKRGEVREGSEFGKRNVERKGRKAKVGKER